MSSLPESISDLFSNETIPVAEQQIKEAMDALPPDIRIILEYRYAKNLSLKDIAPLLHKSLSTVQHRHNYGLFLMEDYIKRHSPV